MKKVLSLDLAQAAKVLFSKYFDLVPTLPVKFLKDECNKL
jgi:hypothetical protein